MQRALHIFSKILNEVTNCPLLSFKFMTVLISPIGFALFAHLPISSLSTVIFVFATLFVLDINIIVSLASTIQNNSQHLVQKLQNDGREILELRKMTESLRECRVHVGSNYFIDRGVLLKINDAIVNNTITLLVAFE